MKHTRRSFLAKSSAAAAFTSSPGHYQEWINACKGGDPAGSNFGWAGPLTEVVLMGNVALRMELKEQLCNQKLEWDIVKGEFSNLPEANAFLTKEYRKGWELLD